MLPWHRVHLHARDDSSSLLLGRDFVYQANNQTDPKETTRLLEEALNHLTDAQLAQPNDDLAQIIQTLESRYMKLKERQHGGMRGQFIEAFTKSRKHRRFKSFMNLTSSFCRVYCLNRTKVPLDGAAYAVVSTVSVYLFSEDMFIFEPSRITFNDVVGMSSQKRLAIQNGLHSTLVYGPPGTGKRMLIKAWANAFEYQVCEVSLDDLHSRDIIQNLLRAASSAERGLILLTDLETFQISNRNYGEMIGLLASLSETPSVIWVGHCNRPWQMCPTMNLQFAHRMYFYPTMHDRFEFLRNRTAALLCRISGNEFRELAQMLVDYTFEDVEHLVTYSRNRSRGGVVLGSIHLECSMPKCPPSISEKTRKKFEEWMSQLWSVEGSAE